MSLILKKEKIIKVCFVLEKQEIDIMIILNLNIEKFQLPSKTDTLDNEDYNEDYNAENQKPL